MFALVASIIDFVMLLTVGYLAWWLVAPDTDQPLLYVLAVLLFAIASVFTFRLSGLYRSYRALALSDWLLRLTLSLALLLVLAVIVLWSAKQSEAFSRLWIGTFFVFAWLVSVFWRVVAHGVLRHLRASGYNHKYIVIVGAGLLGQAIMNKIQLSPWAGFKVVAFFDDDDTKVGASLAGISVLSASELSAWLEEHSVDEIWFALPLRAEERLLRLLHELRHTTANIRYVPNLSSLRLLNHAPREVLGFSMLDLSVSPMSEPLNRLFKALEDKVLAGLILLFISPLMFWLALGVKLSSTGPVFYRQKRVGLNGKVFDMLKFRSMPVDVEKDGVQWGGAAHKTNTWFGAFIRKTSLDELPQFINVLKGDMSIVGPRPERPMFVEQFKDKIPGYMQKHMVKAGITGWAQIHGWRGDTCLKTRIEFDLWYIEHWSLWLDVKIIFMTLFKGLVHKNAQ
ncbi:MAG: undecaprenyl-phosphate glucose phosphotransferase [Gammaproteobacteria bacterium]|nr:undecaprenyl-phosphate glucose phosphotransferase [Gammaproteobacteria bacterium]